MVTIDHKLENGDIIEIVTNPNSAGPSIGLAENSKEQFCEKQNKTVAQERKQKPTLLIKAKTL